MLISYDIELINAIKYVTKDNRERTLIHYRILQDNAITFSDKFKGISILDLYFDSYKVFDLIPNNYYGARCKLTFNKIPNPSDPRREKLEPVKINDIDLV